MGYAPQMGAVPFVMGSREGFAYWLEALISDGLASLAFFFLLFLLRVVLRKTWLAAVVFVAIPTALASLSSSEHLLTAMTIAIFWSTLALALIRFGLVVTIVGFFVSDAFQVIPYTLDFSTWYASRAFVVILSVIALAAWGFYTSLGGQRLLKGELFE